MTRKKFRLILVAFIIISVTIVTGFMVNNLNKRGRTNQGEDTVEVVGEGIINDYNNGNETKDNNLEFYINESSVIKTKSYQKETTLLIFEAKLFITNKDNKTAQIDPDLISVNYNSNGCCQLYDIDYGDVQNPIALAGKETMVLNLTIKYFINDPINFDDYQKRDLKFNYKSKQIFVCVV